MVSSRFFYSEDGRAALDVTGESTKVTKTPDLTNEAMD
jgi:hypothetical protein